MPALRIEPSLRGEPGIGLAALTRDLDAPQQVVRDDRVADPGDAGIGYELQVKDAAGGIEERAGDRQLHIVRRPAVVLGPQVEIDRAGHASGVTGDQVKGVAAEDQQLVRGPIELRRSGSRGLFAQRLRVRKGAQDFAGRGFQHDDSPRAPVHEEPVAPRIQRKQAALFVRQQPLAVARRKDRDPARPAGGSLLQAVEPPALAVNQQGQDKRAIAR